MRETHMRAATGPGFARRCLVLAACISPSVTLALDLTDMLPLDQGSTWRLSADGAQYTVTVTGTGTFESEPVFVMTTVGGGFSFEYYLSKRSTGDFYHGTVASGAGGTVTIAYRPPRLQLPDALDYGQSETQGTTQFLELLPGAPPITNDLTDTVTLVGPELVTVPAGTFAAYKVVVDTEFSVAPIPLAPIPSSSTNWYVPGIGLVKAINVSDEGTETTVLLEYSLAGLDSDGDGLPDDSDPFPNDPDETADSDGDSVGDNADPDDDNDGISDVIELGCGINPLLADTDLDYDDDGLTNEEECLDGTDPLDASDPPRGMNLILIQSALCKQDGDC